MSRRCVALPGAASAPESQAKGLVLGRDGQRDERRRRGRRRAAQRRRHLQSEEVVCGCRESPASDAIYYFRLCGKRNAPRQLHPVPFRRARPSAASAVARGPRGPWGRRCSVGGSAAMGSLAHNEAATALAVALFQPHSSTSIEQSGGIRGARRNPAGNGAAEETAARAPATCGDTGQGPGSRLMLSTAMSLIPTAPTEASIATCGRREGLYTVPAGFH